MNTTNKQDETLEDAARDQFKNVRLGGEHPLNLYLLGNKFGASWQKEQDKVIIDGIFKKMAELKEEYNLMLQARDAVRKISHDRKVIIDKLIETLKKIKDDYFYNKYIEGIQVINNDTRVREILETNELLNKIKEVLQKVENK